MPRGVYSRDGKKPAGKAVATKKTPAKKAAKVETKNAAPVPNPAPPKAKKTASKKQERTGAKGQTEAVSASPLYAWQVKEIIAVMIEAGHLYNMPTLPEGVLEKVGQYIAFKAEELVAQIKIETTAEPESVPEEEPEQVVAPVAPTPVYAAPQAPAPVYQQPATAAPLPVGGLPQGGFAPAPSTPSFPPNPNAQ